MKTAFGKNLRALRERKNLSQRQLAKAINVNNATISSYENGGQYPQRNKIKEDLLQILECTEVELYGYSDGFYEKRLTGALTKYAKEEELRKILNDYKNDVSSDTTDNIIYSIINLNESTSNTENMSLTMPDESMNNLIPPGATLSIKKEENIEKCYQHIIYATYRKEKIVRRLNKIEGEDSILLIPESTNKKLQMQKIDIDELKLHGIVNGFTYKGKLL